MLKLFYYKNDSILFFNQKINNSIINQTQIIHYKSTHLARILKCCKSDQILELHYQSTKKYAKIKKV